MFYINYLLFSQYFVRADYSTNSELQCLIAKLLDKFGKAKAKAGFNKLKQDDNKAGSGVADADMQNFKPNTQKSKSFLKRLEFGMNIQSVKSNLMLPTTSDIALTIGYKLNPQYIYPPPPT